MWTEMKQPSTKGTQFSSTQVRLTPTNPKGRKGLRQLSSCCTGGRSQPDPLRLAIPRGRIEATRGGPRSLPQWVWTAESIGGLPEGTRESLADSGIAPMNLVNCSEAAPRKHAQEAWL